MNNLSLINIAITRYKHITGTGMFIQIYCHYSHYKIVNFKNCVLLLGHNWTMIILGNTWLRSIDQTKCYRSLLKEDRLIVILWIWKFSNYWLMLHNCYKIDKDIKITMLKSYVLSKSLVLNHHSKQL